MTKLECRQFLEESRKKGSVYGLDTIRELLKRLDNPQEKLNIVHIAGTNGKGSILTMIEQTFLEAGYSTGKYISPCVGAYGSQFLYNQMPMPQEELLLYIERIRVVSFKMREEGLAFPTIFEIETALAFLYFYEKKVDILLLETGMGGRLDATNIITHPILVLFASISRDHMAVLGSTLEEIAGEKAGIIKEKVPVVSYPCSKDLQKVLSDAAKKKGAEISFVSKSEVHIEEQDYEKQSFSYRTHKNIRLFLPGAHQIYNAATAILALEKLRARYDLPEEALRQAFAKVRWAARLELLGRAPLVFLDGAHNEDAAKYLADFIQKHFTNRRIIYIIGVLADKEYEKIIEHTWKWAEYIFTITPPCSRALDAKSLAAKISKRTAKVSAAESLEKAYKEARAAAKEEDVILIFGSLSFMHEMRMLIEKEG